jgi:hypothetical protein
VLLNPCSAGAGKRSDKKAASGGSKDEHTSFTGTTLVLLSDLQKKAITSLADFITRQTGIELAVLPYPENGTTAATERNFDLFMGCVVDFRRFDLLSYQGGAWDKYPERSANGVVLWSWWRSCVVLNQTVPGADSADLAGLMTMCRPPSDRLAAAALYTLYQRYGREVLEYLHSHIPLYAGAPGELRAWLESGRYAGAYTVDGRFFQSAADGYPVQFRYDGLSSPEFPEMSVLGRNIAFISAQSSSPDAARAVIDFLAAPAFQEFASAWFSTDPDQGPLPADPFRKNGAASANEEGFIPLVIEEGWVDGLDRVWRDLPHVNWTEMKVE